MARTSLAILFCLGWLASASLAGAESNFREVLGFGGKGDVGDRKRIALMIGNSRYSSVGRLDNPANDAEDIGQALEAVGFDVVYKYDLGREATVRALNEFRRKAAASEAAVLYYAGHGIEVDKKNFMIPVDAKLQTAGDVEFEAVPLDLFTRAVAGAGGLSLVIMDACRNNPFMRTMEATAGHRNIGRGLSGVEPVGNTLVAYAAREGTLAADGDARNSPYAKALVKALGTEGLEIGKFFRQVRDEVLAATGNAQEPFVYGSLSAEDFYFRPPSGVSDPAEDDDDKPDPGTDAEAEIELAFWKTVTELNRPEGYRAYLDRYPNGNFATVARLMLDTKPGMPDPGDEPKDDDANRGDDGKDDGDVFVPKDDPPARKVFDSRQGYHILGMDLRGTERLGISLEACTRHCAAIERCRAFSYNHSRRGCYPKTGIRTVERYSGVTSGAVKEISGRLFARADAKPSRGGGLEYNTDFPGRDLRSYGNGVRGVSLTRCRKICLGDRRCRAYTYVPDSNWCFPKSSISRRRKERRAVSEQIR